tara:strand:- start:2824 stop:4677 length:1854 start_codon:yes stop_codon:yes gene_type:complete
MAPLPNMRQKATAGVGAFGKVITDSIKDTVKTTAKVGVAGIIGPEILTLKSVMSSGLGDLKGSLSQNYADLLGATNDNNDNLDAIKKTGEKNLNTLNKLGTLTESGVLSQLRMISDNTSYLAELKEDLAINQARKELDVQSAPMFTAANDNTPSSDKDKKGMSPLMLAGLIIGGISAFATNFLSALKAGTLKWIKAVGKLTGITALLTKLSTALKFDNIKANLKLFYNNIANNVSRFRTMSVEAFRNAGTTISERLAKLRASILNIFKGEGMVARILTSISRIPKMISSVLQNPFDDIIIGLRSAFTGLKTYTTDLVKGFSLKSVTEPLSKVWNFIKKNPIVTALGKLGSLLGKIFYPIGVALSLYDGMKEGKEEFDKAEGYQKYFKGFQGGVRGFLGSFIGMPLDLLKSVISWALGALGFKKAETFLDSFKIENIIRKLVDGVFDVLYSIINSVIDGIATVAEKLGFDKAANSLKQLKFKSSDDKLNAEAAMKSGVEDLSGVGGSTLNRAGGEIISQKDRRQDYIDGRRMKDLLKDYELKNDKVFVDDLSSTVDKLGQAAKSLNTIAQNIPSNYSAGGTNITSVASAGSNNNNKQSSITFGGNGKSSSKAWENIVL